MDILIIGGTAFFGRDIVDLTLAAGHNVTVFSRGRQRSAFWDRIEHIAGNATWERALFRCFNEVRAAGGRLLVASRQPLASLGFDLPEFTQILGGHDLQRAGAGSVGYSPRVRTRATSPILEVVGAEHAAVFVDGKPGLDVTFRRRVVVAVDAF